MSGHILHLAISHSPVFLVNSCLGLSSAARIAAGAPSPEVTGPFCRVPWPWITRAPQYAQPNHLCRFAVRAARLAISWAAAGAARFPRGVGSAGHVRRPACVRPLPSLLSLPRGRSIVRLLAIGFPLRVCLRARLTLIRLALIRNPESFGGRGSHPSCRYSCLHLPFRALHRASRLRIRRARNAPLPTPRSLARVPRLRRRASCPIIIHAGALD